MICRLFEGFIFWGGALFPQGGALIPAVRALPTPSGALIPRARALLTPGGALIPRPERFTTQVERLYHDPERFLPRMERLNLGRERFSTQMERLTHTASASPLNLPQTKINIIFSPYLFPNFTTPLTTNSGSSP